MAVAFGLILSLCSLCIGFTALNLQRVAQRRDNPRPALNMCGVLLNVLVGPTDMAAYTFAPQSLLAPVGTLSLVFNLVAAPRIHGDRVTRRDAMATALIVLGTAVCIVFGAHERGGHDGDGGPHGGHDEDGGPTMFAVVNYVVTVLLLGAALGSVLVRQRSSDGRADAAANAALAGLLGSTTVVAGKAVGHALASAEPISIAVSFIPLLCLAPTHLFVINRGMGRYSSVVFVPLNVAAGLLANIAVGFTLFGEHPESWPCFCAGVSILLGGVLSMALSGGDPAASEVHVSPPATGGTPKNISGVAGGGASTPSLLDTAGGALEFRRTRSGRKPSWSNEKPKVV